MSKFFEWDGSWRDLYVFGTRLSDWHRLFDALRACEWQVTFQHAGVDGSVPSDAGKCFADDDHSSLLSIAVDGLVANCHFFSVDEIEFDLDPREITNQQSLDSLAKFMAFLANATGKPVVLTYENFPEYARCKCVPGDDAVECEP